MLREGDKKDQQLVALRIFFESGTEEEKETHYLLTRFLPLQTAQPTHQITPASHWMTVVKQRQ